MMKANDFAFIYRRLCDELLHADIVGNTRELPNTRFTILDINTCTSSIRCPELSYVCGELLWYLRGSNSCEFISKFGKMWSRLSDDGLTNNSAYGYILKYKHGFNQIDKIVELLKKDPLSRRALININCANERVIETHDEPCTIALQFLIRDNKLHCTGMMRSNDIWLGLPYDIIFFTTIQKIIADELGIEYGSYTHFATSLHAYERDLEKIKTALFKNEIVEFEIDHRILCEKTEQLYKKVNEMETPKTDIVKLFTELNILKIKE